MFAISHWQSVLARTQWFGNWFPVFSDFYPGTKKPFQCLLKRLLWPQEYGIQLFVR